MSWAPDPPNLGPPHPPWPLAPWWPVLAPVRRRAVVCSGHFELLHQGHLNYLEAAAQLGDLTVIVNSAGQLSRKKGRTPLVGEEERLRLVAALRCVTRAVLSADDGPSVAGTLRILRGLGQADIFCNGGDVTEENCRETGVCRALGIELLFGVGGAKADSSTDILKRAACRGEGEVPPPPGAAR